MDRRGFLGGAIGALISLPKLAKAGLPSRSIISKLKPLQLSLMVPGRIEPILTSPNVNLMIEPQILKYCKVTNEEGFGVIIYMDIWNTIIREVNNANL